MLNVVILSVMVLNAIMLSVSMLRLLMLNVVPKKMGSSIKKVSIFFLKRT